MKKVCAIIIAALMVFSTTVFANEIEVLVNDEAVNFDVQPQTMEGIVMIPMRFVMEKLNASIMYDDETETISTYLLDGEGKASFIIIQIGNNKVFVNDGMHQLEVAPVLAEDRTLVSVEFFEKVLPDAVAFDEQNSRLSIIFEMQQQPSE
ncbi:MAG: copper amine oxidase N-terminal domain-containing protein [Firmicutes bacterium]|nr:copper amine oxidase N-terminal domain-containing protein [Bacillota bacterium]